MWQKREHNESSTTSHTGIHAQLYGLQAARFDYLTGSTYEQISLDSGTDIKATVLTVIALIFLVYRPTSIVRTTFHLTSCIGERWTTSHVIYLAWFLHREGKASLRSVINVQKPKRFDALEVQSNCTTSFVVRAVLACRFDPQKKWVRYRNPSESGNHPAQKTNWLGVAKVSIFAWIDSPWAERSAGMPWLVDCRLF